MTDLEFTELVEKVYKFHTKRAPGIPIGVEMVLLAKEKLGDVKKLGAVTETQVCLSDAIQYLTGCTVGNKYLVMHDKIGRYALTLYDRSNGRGIRVFVDMKKLDPEKMPETHKFFLRQRSPGIEKDDAARKESASKIVDEFMVCGRNIFGWQYVRLKEYAKDPVNPVRICPGCGESYIYSDKESKNCLVCDRQLEYYVSEQ
jgi:formylmethanofuran dehydrogenase subunit E